jgi:hypothetical protein
MYAEDRNAAGRRGLGRRVVRHFRERFAVKFVEELDPKVLCGW